MKNTIIAGIVSVLGLLLHARIVPANEPVTESDDGTVTVFTSYTRPKGKPTDRTGAFYQGHFIKAMLEDANIPYQIKYMPFARAKATLKHTRNSLFFPMSRTPDREDKYVWIGRISPNSENMTYLYKLKSRTDINLTDLDSARPYTIGVGRANLFRQYLERHGFENLAPTNKRRESLQMLLAGRIDLLSHYSFNIITTCNQLNVTTDLLSPALLLENLTSGVYLIASPNSDPNFKKKLMDAYRAKVAEGMVDALVDSLHAKSKYFPAPD